MIREAANSGPRRDLLGADLQRLFGALFVVQSFTAGSNRSFCRFQLRTPARRWYAGYRRRYDYM